MVGMHRTVPQDISLTKAGEVMSPGVVGGPEAAGGEGGGVWLSHDQLLAGELKQGSAVLRRREEGVVLLGGDAGKGLEPVGVVGSALFHGPVLHGSGHDVSGGHGDVAAVIHHIYQFGVYLFGQAFLHDGSAEYVGSKNFSDTVAQADQPLSNYYHNSLSLPPMARKNLANIPSEPKEVVEKIHKGGHPEGGMRGEGDA